MSFTDLRTIFNNVWDSVNSALRVNVVAGGGGGGAVTVVDGGDVTQGSIADAAVTGDNPGTVNAHLRGIDKTLLTGVAVQGIQAAGAAITEQPVLVAGQFGGNVKLLGLDTNGGITQGQPNAAGTSSWPVQGAAAAGAAVAGNPLLVGISDGTNAQTWRQTQTTLATTGSTTGVPLVMAGLLQGTTDARPAGAFNGVGDGGNGTNALAAGAMAWNGATADRQRNNTDVTFLASASRTTTQGPTNITTFNARAIYIVLDMTVVGTGSVTLSVDMVDPASTKKVNLLTGAAVTTNGTNIYKIGVGLTAAANLVVNEYLPRTITITVTANNANPATYSVGYSLIAA